MNSNGQKIGYARVSTFDQNIELQTARLKEAGVTRIFSDKGITGTSRAQRQGLKNLLEYLRDDDTVLITRIDRLARSARDLQNIVAEIGSKGASLRCTEQAFDTSRPEGRFMLGMLALVAELETELRKERQREGIEAAKKQGKFKGRPADQKRVEDVLQLRTEGLSYGQIAKKIGMSRSGVQGICERQKQ